MKKQTVMPLFRSFSAFFADLWLNRAILLELVRNDFRQQYLGSYLGIVWAFINPLVYVAIFVVIFSVGFKAAPISGAPYLLWLVGGLFPWNYFSIGISSGISSVVENAYLVKKIRFRLALLPLIKLASNMLLHFVFLGLAVLLFAAYGRMPGWHILQIPYYMLAASVLILGISWLTAAIAVFFRDIQQIMNVLLQFAFWGTPIFWQEEMLPEKYRAFLLLNPVLYIIQGYRDSFFESAWFWQHPGRMLYFWGIAIFFFVSGGLVFRRLRPHFADVL